MSGRRRVTSRRLWPAPRRWLRSCWATAWPDRSWRSNAMWLVLAWRRAPSSSLPSPPLGRPALRFHPAPRSRLGWKEALHERRDRRRVHLWLARVRQQTIALLLDVRELRVTKTGEEMQLGETL